MFIVLTFLTHVCSNSRFSLLEGFHSVLKSNKLDADHAKARVSFVGLGPPLLCSKENIQDASSRLALYTLWLAQTNYCPSRVRIVGMSVDGGGLLQNMFL